MQSLVPYQAMNKATASINTSISVTSTPRSATGNRSVTMATAICALARYPAAAPKKVNTTMSRIEIGSGHCDPVPKT